MSQTWTDTTYHATGVAAATDLQAIEDNFAALKSNFAGISSPAAGSGVIDGLIWKDTTQKLWKGYNGSSYYGFMHGDTNQKIWVYRNSAMDGWAIDSSVTDKVISLKGTTGDTYETAGTTAGNWTISGMSHTHTIATHIHKIYKHNASSVTDDKYYNSSGIATDCDISSDEKAEGSFGWPANIEGGEKSDSRVQSVDLYTKSGGATTTGSGGASDGSWRPAAAVGTLQYLDI